MRVETRAYPMSMSGSCQNGVYPAIEKPTRFSDRNRAVWSGLRPTNQFRRENDRFSDIHGVCGQCSATGRTRPIAIILEMEFSDQQALDACLASSIRPESHAATEAVMTLFDGRFYHLVSKATVLTPAARSNVIQSLPRCRLLLRFVGLAVMDGHGLKMAIGGAGVDTIKPPSFFREYQDFVARTADHLWYGA